MYTIRKKQCNCLFTWIKKIHSILSTYKIHKNLFLDWLLWYTVVYMYIWFIFIWIYVYKISLLWSLKDKHAFIAWWAEGSHIRFINTIYIIPNIFKSLFIWQCFQLRSSHASHRQLIWHQEINLRQDLRSSIIVSCSPLLLLPCTGQNHVCETKTHNTADNKPDHNLEMWMLTFGFALGLIIQSTDEFFDPGALGRKRST